MPVHQLEQRRVVVEIDTRLVATGVKGAQLERLTTFRPPTKEALANTLLDDLTDRLPPRGSDLPNLVQQVLVDRDRGAHSIRAYQRCIMMHRPQSSRDSRDARMSPLRTATFDSRVDARPWVCSVAPCT